VAQAGWFRLNGVEIRSRNLEAASTTVFEAPPPWVKS